MVDLGQDMQPGVVHSVRVRSMDISVFVGNGTLRRAFATLALAAFVILAYCPACGAHEFAYHPAEAGELCCSALDPDTIVSPATSALPAGDRSGAPDLGVLAALIPLAVPRRHQWLPAGAFSPLALGSYPRRSARLLR